MNKYSEFIVLDKNLLSDEFILFNIFNITVDRQQVNLDKPIYLGIDNNNINSVLFSNLTIIQQDENNVDKNIAYFYRSYSYAKAIALMLKDNNNVLNYRLYISKENLIVTNQFKMNVYLYINKIYLLNLYQSTDLPEIIYNVIIDNVKKQTNNDTLVEIPIQELDLTPINSQNRPFYNYQISNINKMLTLERNIKLNSNTIDCINIMDDYKVYYIESINDYLILDINQKRLIPMEYCPLVNFSFNGGILADEVGLGKTYSMIGLISESIRNGNQKPSLIVCPKRLCQQWAKEISDNTILSYFVISNIRQFKKLSYENISNYNCIIVSYQFLTNTRYTDLHIIPDTFLLNRFCWERIILDEGHEYITQVITSLRKKHYRITLDYLYTLKCNYKWICSGTPFTGKNDFWQVTHFLMNNYDEVYSYTNPFGYSSESDAPMYPRSPSNILHCKELAKLKKIFRQSETNIIEKLVIKNSKQLINNEVTIPDPIITNQFLDMSQIERAIYDSAFGDKTKMIELCNHPQVNDDNFNILGNKPLSLDEIHLKMTDYYSNKVSKYQRQITNINGQIGKTTNELQLDILNNNLLEKKELLISNQKRLDIFTQLKEKLKAETECLVCYETYDNLIKTVLPCGHFICSGCITKINGLNHKLSCPMCRLEFSKDKVEVISNNNINDNSQKLGTKMASLIDYCHETLSDPSHKIIIFSQWDNMLKLLSKVLLQYEIKHLILNGNYYSINKKLREFKLDSRIRIILLSSDKAASGLNLTEASHIVLLDTLNTEKNEAKQIERQAIGRACRIGQTKNVLVNRFIMRDTIEEDFYRENV